MENIDTESDLSANPNAQSWKFDKNYIIKLAIILGLAHALDEYSTLAPGMIQSSLIEEFFIPNGYTQTEAAQIMSMLGLVTVALLIFSMMYKGLQDKYGRRKIFIVAVIGMTVGIGVQSIAPSFPIYFVGSIITTFFISNDMQYIYINEEAPAKYRTQLLSAAKIIGLLAILAVPAIRQVFITETEENWRPVLYFPFALGIIVILITVLFLRESRAYTILKKDRKANPEKYKHEKLNLRQARRDFKAMPSWKQFRILVIRGCITILFTVFNAQSTELFMDQVAISESGKNTVLALTTIFTGVAYFASGQLSDRIGRKAAMIINYSVVFLLLGVEYFAVLNHWIWLAGIATGLRIGAFWSGGDVGGIALMESTPTRLRGFAQMYSGLISFPFVILAIIINTVLLNFTTYVFGPFLIIGLPVNLAAILLTVFKIKETKNVDITQIEG